MQKALDLVEKHKEWHHLYQCCHSVVTEKYLLGLDFMIKKH